MLTDTADALTQRGISCEAGGELELAMQFYIDAIAIDPECTAAHVNMGTMLLQRGNTREAIAHYRIAVQVSPTYGLALFNLGTSLENEGQIKEAVALYLRAVAAGFVDAHYNLALLFDDVGPATKREALVHWSAYVKETPNKLDDYYKHARKRMKALLRGDQVQLTHTNPQPQRTPQRGRLELVHGARY